MRLSMYERGFVAGMVVTALAWLITWLVCVGIPC
jgi:Na+/proline symporter